MKRGFLDTLVFSFTIIAFAAHAVSQAPQRWTADRANQWYAQQAWLVGANYIPSDAINELEMFQAATFNPALNDKELGLAESIGMNTARVFLQDQLWKQDPQGLNKRLDEFLTIAAKHHIRPLLVLFDSCWETDPHLGPQHPPIPGVHNSGWVQSPGKQRLMDPKVQPELEAYVKGVVGAFGQDQRILAWDIWNEPAGEGRDKPEDVPAKIKRVNELLPRHLPGRAAFIHPSRLPAVSGTATGAILPRRVIPPKFNSPSPISSPSTTTAGPSNLKRVSRNSSPSAAPSCAPNTWPAATAAPSTDRSPSRKNTTSPPSTGVWSLAKPKLTFPGIPGKNPTC